MIYSYVLCTVAYAIMTSSGPNTLVATAQYGKILREVGSERLLVRFTQRPKGYKYIDGQILMVLENSCLYTEKLSAK